MPRTRESLRKAYRQSTPRWTWVECLGQDLNKCGWKVKVRVGHIGWCEDCWEDYLSDRDAYK